MQSVYATVDFNEVFKFFVLTNDYVGLNVCLDHSLNYVFLLEWMYSQKRYFGLELILPNLKPKRYTGKLKLKIYAEALVTDNAELAGKVKPFIEVQSEELSYLFGKLGYNHQKFSDAYQREECNETRNECSIKISSLDSNKYVRGLIARNQITVFRKIIDSMTGLDMQEVCYFIGLRNKGNFMQCLGFAPHYVASYIDGLLHAGIFGSGSMTKELLLKVAPEVCNDFLRYWLDRPLGLNRARWLLDKGAYLSKEELQSLKEKKPDIFAAVFADDV